MNKDWKKEENEELDLFMEENPNLLTDFIELFEKGAQEYIKQREEELGKLGLKRITTFSNMDNKKYSAHRYFGSNMRIRFTTTCGTTDELFLEYQGEGYGDFYSIPVFRCGLKSGERSTKTIELLISVLESAPVHTVITPAQLKKLGFKVLNTNYDNYVGIYEVNYDYMIVVSRTGIDRKEQSISIVTNYLQNPDFNDIESIPLQTKGNLSVEAIKNLIEAFKD